MRIVPIAEISKLEAGETVPSVQGTIVKVSDRYTGTNDKGEWSTQKIELKDSSGSIKLAVWGHPPIAKDWTGRQICVSCNEGDRGLTGLKADDDEYKGKVTRQVKVTGSAHIDLVQSQASAPAAPQTRQTAPSTHPAPESAPQSQPAPPVSPKNGNGHANGNGKSLTDYQADIMEAKKFAGKICNALEIGYAAAVNLAGRIRTKHGVEMQSDEMERIAVHISISLEKQGLFGKLPSAPIDEYLKK